MIHDLFETAKLTDEQRHLFARMSESTVTFFPNTSLLSQTGRELAKQFIATISDLGRTMPSRVAVLFEMEDADTAATAFCNVFSSYKTEIRIGCFWIESRIGSSADVLVEITRDYVENLTDCEAVLVLQPKKIASERVHAMLVRLARRMPENCPIVVLSSGASDATMLELEEDLSSDFDNILLVARLADVPDDADIALVEDCFVSKDLYEKKADTFPLFVRRRIQLDMELRRSSDSTLTI